MRLFDSHCHLDFEALNGERAAVIERARAAGVEALLIPGVDATQHQRSAHVDGGGLRVLRAAGLHPGSVRAGSSVDDVASWATRLEAVAIGELGWHAPAPAPLETQDRVVDALLALARELGLPLILHVVGAHAHALSRLKRFAPLPGVVHAYSGSAELVAAYTRLGLHVSIGPSVLRANAKRPLAAARAIPGDRLLIETDAPDQIGEPADLARVAEAVARARGEPVEAVARATFENAERLFGRAREPGE